MSAQIITTLISVPHGARTDYVYDAADNCLSFNVRHGNPTGTIVGTMHYQWDAKNRVILQYFEDKR